MRSCVLFILSLFVFVLNNAQNWELLWSEEFNYSGLPDPVNWTMRSVISETMNFNIIPLNALKILEL
jgi:hypothetical protein